MSAGSAVSLRRFDTADRPQLSAWAEAIGSTDYMARYVPKAGHSLIWDLILVDGEACGTIWLEHTDTPLEARLGIMLAAPNILGHGIGQKAIALIVAKACEQLSLQSIVLNVRASNARAVACYQRCGFSLEGTTLRQAEGVEYRVLTMRKRLVHA